MTMQIDTKSWVRVRLCIMIGETAQDAALIKLRMLDYGPGAHDTCDDLPLYMPSHYGGMSRSQWLSWSRACANSHYSAFAVACELLRQCQSPESCCLACLMLGDATTGSTASLQSICTLHCRASRMLPASRDSHSAFIPRMSRPPYSTCSRTCLTATCLSESVAHVSHISQESC